MADLKAHAGVVDVDTGQPILEYWSDNGDTTYSRKIAASQTTWTPISLPALTATATAIKAAAGTIGGWYLYNPNSTVVYVQLFDAATGAVTLGSTAPVAALGIPAGSAANVVSAAGINFTTAITVAATTTATGSTAPASALVASFFYR